MYVLRSFFSFMDVRVAYSFEHLCDNKFSCCFCQNLKTGTVPENDYELIQKVGMKKKNYSIIMSYL